MHYTFGPGRTGCEADPEALVYHIDRYLGYGGAKSDPRGAFGARPEMSRILIYRLLGSMGEYIQKIDF